MIGGGAQGQKFYKKGNIIGDNSIIYGSSMNNINIITIMYTVNITLYQNHDVTIIQGKEVLVFVSSVFVLGRSIRKPNSHLPQWKVEIICEIEKKNKPTID